MDNNINPFLTENYIDKTYFCDREYELEVLSTHIKNGLNTTLISNRRMGKSALIYRLFEDLEAENVVCIYTDIYACLCLKDLTETLASAVYKRFPERKGLGKRFLDWLKGFRPVITYDALSGQPEVHFEYANTQEYERTLQGLLRFLDEQSSPVVVAIDEFQQVSEFSELNVEALLRTVVQTLKNTRFIFSGSKKHTMAEIFTGAKRPFFASTQMLGLEEIAADKYRAFIIEKFAERKRHIDDEAVDFILDWTLRHTYYTQLICNCAFARREKRITLDLVKQVCDAQLSLHQATFMEYRNLLSPIQWKMLIAIAKEGGISEPQAKTFLQKYQLSASSAKKAITALVDKEMVCTINTDDKTFYRPYNVLLMRWAKKD